VASIRERMADRRLFSDLDPNYRAEAAELAQARQRGKELCWKINQLNPTDVETRTRLIRELFSKVGPNVWLEPPIHMAYGSNTSIGDFVYINSGLTVIDDYKVTVGDRVMFGPNVTILVTNHPIHPERRAEGGMFALPVHIEDDVWIGACAVIMPGVTIGAGTTIGAGSVVTRDIPPNVVAFGNPCRVYREITEHDREFYYQDLRFD